MTGLLITFEGNEGSGKSTQIKRLARRLRKAGQDVLTLREPGSTPISEEIRHTLKHSRQNEAMTPEAELLLMNASRAQLVREVIRPALAAGRIVLCDRFYDSTTAYQGYGREMDLAWVKAVIDFAVGDTHPDLTLLMQVSHELSEHRRKQRQVRLSSPRDRFEEADRRFFERVEKGYHTIAEQEPRRVKVIPADASPEETERMVWNTVRPLIQIRHKT